jgi:hypothetical protein
MLMGTRFALVCASVIAGAAACGSRASTPIEVAPDGSTTGSGGDAGLSRHDAGSPPSHGDGGTGGEHDSGRAPVDAAPATDAGGTSAHCKRGIATNIVPSSGFSPTSSNPGVSWWYNWSASGSGAAAGISFVPMIWGSASLGASLPAGSQYVLGFNEPNFASQSNLTPMQAASDWSSVEGTAKAVNASIVSPAVNFCGSSTNTSGCSDPSVTDPYTYLKDFFADCPACDVDYVAVHWYNCDLPSLQAYIEGNLDAGGGLQGFVQFGKPIWLTEFSCDGSHSVADQTAYMQAAVPWLEQNPHIFRYSWFSASAIASAQLANPDGSLTTLGTTYVGLAEDCQ